MLQSEDQQVCGGESPAFLSEAMQGVVPLNEIRPAVRASPLRAANRPTTHRPHPPFAENTRPQVETNKRTKGSGKSRIPHRLPIPLHFDCSRSGKYMVDGLS